MQNARVRKGNFWAAFYPNPLHMKKARGRPRGSRGFRICILVLCHWFVVCLGRRRFGLSGRGSARDEVAAAEFVEQVVDALARRIEARHRILEFLVDFLKAALDGVDLRFSVHLSEYFAAALQRERANFFHRLHEFNQQVTALAPLGAVRLVLAALRPRFTTRCCPFMPAGFQISGFSQDSGNSHRSNWND